MSATQRRATAGFTIIEVLIVLAIAGIILLIVFQAIPTLQRNSRNDQRKQNVTVILEKISNYELNNTGDIPDTATLQTRLTTPSNELTIYDPGDITVTSGRFGEPQDRAAVTNLDTVSVYNYQRCNT
ncbi:MAG: type II secretion system protein, partial [Candidatus Saccharimonadales bacterium]